LCRRCRELHVNSKRLDQLGEQRFIKTLSQG
jgi:hypothetical protein